MNDPHVEKLYYRFISENPGDSFEKAQPLTITLGSFSVEIHDGQLVATPKDHYPGEESAKVEFEPILHSWESSAFLSPIKLRIRFKFDHADVIDRNPTPGLVSLHVHGVETIFTLGTPTLTVVHNLYPSPDTGFVASSLTDELIYRLQQYKDGRQTLPHVAYYILDKLEQEFGEGKKGKRTEAAKVLNVNYAVLDKFGNYSNKPDVRIGRHASRHDIPLTREELVWLEEVAFRLVRRVGEINAGTTPLSPIGMDSFPPI